MNGEYFNFSKSIYLILNPLESNPLYLSYFIFDEPLKFRKSVKATVDILGKYDGSILSRNVG